MRYKNISKLQLLKHDTAIVTVVVVVEPTGTLWSRPRQTPRQAPPKTTMPGTAEGRCCCTRQEGPHSTIETFHPEVLFCSQQGAGLAPPKTRSLFEMARRPRLTCARHCHRCSMDSESRYGAPTCRTIAGGSRQSVPRHPTVRNHDQGRTVVLTCEEGWWRRGRRRNATRKRIGRWGDGVADCSKLVGVREELMKKVSLN